MNPLIQNQLKKVKNVEIPEELISNEVTKITLNQIDAVSENLLEEDKCYLIEVANYILNPPEGFTLHSNWNNNVIPKNKIMKIDVLKIMGKMIKVNAIGYDPEQNKSLEVWEGWLPKKSITILERY